MAAIGPRFSEITHDDGLSWNNLLPLQAFTYWFGFQPRAGLVVEGYYGYGTDTGFLHSKDAISWGEVTPVPFTSGSTLSGFDNAGDVFISDGSVTTDLGMTWLSHQSPPGNQVIGLPDGSAVCAGSGGLYRSTNQGAAWQFTPSAAISGFIQCVTCDSTSNILVSTSSGAFLSKDIGKNWASVSNGLPLDSLPRQLCYSTEGFWLAATGRGVFLLNEGENTWQSASDGLDDPDILCIDVAGPGKYYAGTSIAGIYTTEAPPSSVNFSKSTLSATALALYPNPFSQSTNITFTSEAAGYADVSIVNLLGVEVAHLFSGELVAGEHSFEWSKPAGLPDGMYECLVRMNGRVETLPVVVQK